MNTMRDLILFCTAALLPTAACTTGPTTVSGTITQGGVPVPGAAAEVLGTRILSGLDGSYSAEVEPGISFTITVEINRGLGRVSALGEADTHEGDAIVDFAFPAGARLRDAETGMDAEGAWAALSWMNPVANGFVGNLIHLQPMDSLAVPPIDFAAQVAFDTPTTSVTTTTLRNLAPSARYALFIETQGTDGPITYSVSSNAVVAQMPTL